TRPVPCSVTPSYQFNPAASFRVLARMFFSKQHIAHFHLLIRLDTKRLRFRHSGITSFASCELQNKAIDARPERNIQLTLKEIEIRLALLVGISISRVVCEGTCCRFQSLY